MSLLGGSFLRQPTAQRGTPITAAQFNAAASRPLTGIVPADSPLAKYVAPANVGLPTAVAAPRIITTTATPLQLPPTLVKPIALAPVVAPAPTNSMSLLGNIGSAVSTAVGTINRALPAVTTLVGGIQQLTGGTSRPPAPGLPSLPSGLPSFIPQTIGGAVGGFVGQLTQGQQQGSCGCNGSKGRDPCTRQSSASSPAPLATFFGGCCPPGRVLRRRALGRDICMKQPRMNPFNPRALARADRRITTFVRRAAPILSDMGFNVERRRRPVKGVKTGGRRRARRG